MKLIKIFSTPETRQSLEYFNTKTEWMDYKIIYDNDIRQCDVMVVFAEGGWNNYRFHTTAKRRICFTGEPETIYKFSPDFLNQFTDVVTSQIDIKLDPSVVVHHISQGNNLFIGADFGDMHRKINIYEAEKTFNNRIKPKLISVCCSNKSFTVYHKKRQEFIFRLAQDIPELDIFGGIVGRQIQLKDYAIRDYKYSIAIENTKTDDYWTEKLGDCIYGLAEPIYCGCTNIKKYFPNITVIDIENYEDSLRTIKNKIYGPYSMNNILQMRTTMLNKYTLHNIIFTILGESNV